MLKSTDPENFFQTTDSIAEARRKAIKSKNNDGNPIRNSSKILAVIVDPSDAGRIYVAEAAGTARRVTLEVGHKGYIFRGPTAPLTSITLSPDGQTLYGGCWDKTIWSWDVETRASKNRFRGHTDFVKCVLSLRLPSFPFEILITGSSDASIIIWNATSGKKLQTLKGHSMGVLALALDPTTLAQRQSAPEKGFDNDSEPVILFSASSDRTILRWALQFTTTPPSITATPFPKIISPLIPHETSIYALTFAPTTSPLTDPPDLYTASADGTAKCLSRTHNWEPDTTFAHGDYVRAIALSADEKWVITAGRDEDVKVWDRSTGELWHRYEGHYDEITGVVVVGEKVVSVGIDATIRVWGLGDAALEVARKEAEERESGVVKEEEVREVEGGLTEEEERELEELMEDD